MIQINTPQIQLLKETDAIFASALITNEIDLSNTQLAQIIITTDAPKTNETPISAETTLTVEATDGTYYTKIPFTLINAEGGSEEIVDIGKQITIGKNAFYIVKVDADNLGKIGFKNIVVKTTAITDCIIKGTVIAILSLPRYNN